MTPVIRVCSVEKSYDALPVLFEVSLEVMAGETLAIIGPNGAGKTTMFRVLTGEAIADKGQILFSNRDITALPPEYRVRLGIGRTFQIAKVLLSDTVLSNLVVAIEARLRNTGERIGRWFSIAPSVRVKAEAERMSELVGLHAKLDVEARHLSHGDRKRLELAAVLCLRPSVLMLDEPTAGMSPADRTLAVALIRQVKEQEKLTVMLTEHDMEVVFGLSDRVLVLNLGRVVACDTPANIRSHPGVRAVYLGKEAR